MHRAQFFLRIRPMAHAPAQRGRGPRGGGCRVGLPVEMRVLLLSRVRLLLLLAHARAFCLSFLPLGARGAQGSLWARGRGAEGARDWLWPFERSALYFTAHTRPRPLDSRAVASMPWGVSL